jgi:chaperonin GroES
MANECGIKPILYNVVVKPRKVEEKTAGGLYMPDEVREKEQHGEMRGTIVAKSPGAFTFNYEGWPEDGKLPDIGDEVVFLRYEGRAIEGGDGEEYWLMADKAIMAVLA